MTTETHPTMGEIIENLVSAGLGHKIESTEPEEETNSFKLVIYSNLNIGLWVPK